MKFIPAITVLCTDIVSYYRDNEKSTVKFNGYCNGIKKNKWRKEENLKVLAMQSPGTIAK